MSLEAEIKAGSLERGRFRYFPVVPGRVEFAAALRKLLLEQKPADRRGRTPRVSRTEPTAERWRACPKCR